MNYELKKVKRLQNRISESRFALPITAVYALGAWLVMCAVSGRTYAELAVFALSAYLMVELNNRNALIRVYSRMVSCTFLVLGTMAAPVTGSVEVVIVQLCFIAAYLTLFASYQDKRAQGRMFYAFMFIGIASVIFPQSLFFVPVLWVLIGTNLMAMSWRNFWASLIGLTAPYWFIGGYCAMTGSFFEVTQKLKFDVWTVHPYDITISVDTAATFGFTLLAAAIGTVHFLRNSYKDKIRTRMIYEMLITLAAFTAALAVLQPVNAGQLTGILIVNASVLAGHFFALTGTRFTNIAFILLALLAIAITAFNIMNITPAANNLSPWSL